jgi:hypothetical protein
LDRTPTTWMLEAGHGTARGRARVRCWALDVHPLRRSLSRDNKGRRPRDRPTPLKCLKPLPRLRHSGLRFHFQRRTGAYVQRGCTCVSPLGYSHGVAGASSTEAKIGQRSVV